MDRAAWCVHSKRIISTLNKGLQEGKYKGTDEESLLKGLQPGTPPALSKSLWSSLLNGAHPRRPRVFVNSAQTTSSAGLATRRASSGRRHSTARPCSRPTGRYVSVCDQS